MAGHQTYEEGKQMVFRGLLILGIITIVEVLFALSAKGHIPGIPAFYHSPVGKAVYMVAMIAASLYKAYFIVFFFMHMAFEVRGLVLSVLLPCILLIWAIIAFFQEGSSWGKSRERIREKDLENETAPAKPAAPKQGSLYVLPAGQSVI